MTDSEAVEKLRAYLKCKAREVKGIYEDCNNKRCDDCDLCYMQGTTGEHRTAIGIAIQALEKQIEMKKYCDENGCTDCPYHNTSLKDNRCMNDFIIDWSNEE